MSRLPGATLLTTRSPIRIRPDEMSSSPASIRSAVVLPQPEGPTRTRNSPSATSMLRSSTATVSSNRFVTCSNAIVAIRRRSSGVGASSEVRRGEKRCTRRVSVRNGITAAATPDGVHEQERQPEHDRAARTPPHDQERLARAPSGEAARLGDRERPEDELVDAEQDEDVERRASRAATGTPSRVRSERRERRAASAAAPAAPSASPRRQWRRSPSPAVGERQVLRSARASPRSARAPPRSARPPGRTIVAAGTASVATKPATSTAPRAALIGTRRHELA